jgi:hypothetical protein
LTEAGEPGNVLGIRGQTGETEPGDRLVARELDEHGLGRFGSHPSRLRHEHGHAAVGLEHVAVKGNVDGVHAVERLGDALLAKTHAALGDELLLGRVQAAGSD